MKKKSKHYLYIIGGPARVGKTTVAKKVRQRRPLMMFSTDALRSAVSSIFLGESRMSLEKIGMHQRFSFKGTVAFQRSNTPKIQKLTFTKSGQDRDDLAWLAAVGLIHAYDKANTIDILVEGNAVTPERIHRLKLKNLAIRATFIGYSDESYLASILAYSKKNKDWVHKWIQEYGGDDTHVKQWAKGKVKRSALIEKSAKKFGYGYFDATERPFKKHVEAVTDYLLR